MEKKPILRVLNGETLETPPVWLMRQAGRYLPEYRETRAKAGSFLDLCYNPELATEVTLQPLRRYNFDAAILFADILLIPHALGTDLRFVAGEGPKLSTIETLQDLNALKPVDDIDETLSPVYETVKNVSSSLPQNTTMIGFAGAPWTVATYMIEGGGSKTHDKSRAMAFSNPDLFDALIALIEKATIHYLSKQIEAGAEVIKLFDSWAGALPYSLIERYSIAPMRNIALALKETHPDVKIMAFPRGIGAFYAELVHETVFDGIAVDAGTNPAWIRNLLPKTALQGNLDPMAIVAGGDALKKEARRVLDGFSSGPHIFNLGHGITPNAEPDHVNELLEIIRG